MASKKPVRKLSARGDEPEILGVMQQEQPTEEQEELLTSALQEMDSVIFWFNEVEKSIKSASAVASSSYVEHIKRQIPKIINDLELFRGQLNRK